MSPPDYYLGKSGQQAREVIEDFDLNYNLGTAVAYILRAGKKPGNDKAHDLAKAREHLTFEIGDEKHIVSDAKESERRFATAIEALQKIAKPLSVFSGEACRSEALDRIDAAREALKQIEGN